MRKLSVVFCILAMVATLPAVAQEVDGVQFFPVVARTTGVGTSQWVSDLTAEQPPG